MSGDNKRFWNRWAKRYDTVIRKDAKAYRRVFSAGVRGRARDHAGQN